MNEKQRFEMLNKHYNDLRYTESFTISRVNFNFLLISHNKYLKSQEENKQLKQQIKLLEMANR